MSLLFICWKNQILVLLIYAIVSFVSSSFTSALIFMISFLLLTLRLFLSSCSICFRCKVWLFNFTLVSRCKLILLWTFPLILLLLNHIDFVLFCYHFYLFLCIFSFLFLFLPWFVDYSEACCLASIYLYFNSFFFL